MINHSSKQTVAKSFTNHNLFSQAFAGSHVVTLAALVVQDPYMGLWIDSHIHLPKTCSVRTSHEDQILGQWHHL